MPQKVTISKISDDVIACDLCFAPPKSKILATPMSETLTTCSGDLDFMIIHNKRLDFQRLAGSSKNVLFLPKFNALPPGGSRKAFPNLLKF